MALRAIAFLLIYLAGIVFSLVKGPWYGLLVYIFVYYKFPPLHWWGKDLPNLRYSLMMVLVLLVSYLIHQSKCSKISIWRVPQTKWFVLLLVITTIVTFSPLAISQTESWRMASEFLEFFLKYYLIIKIVNTPSKWKLFIWANIVGCFLWGWEAYQDPSLQAGRLEGLGGPDSRTSNAVAAHVVTFIPLLIFYVMQMKSWRRIVPLGCSAFILNLIILTNSRSAILGLAAAMFVFFWVIPSRMKLKIFVGILIGGLLFWHLTDARFWRRQKTTLSYEEDSSSTGRLDTWKGGLRLIRDHPLGVGGYGSDLLSSIYWPSVVQTHGGELRTMHNTFLMMAADWGILGLFAFCMLLGSTLWYLRRSAKSLIESDNPKGQEIAGAALALQAGFVGFLVCAFFRNRQWAELIYWVVALSGVLHSNVLPMLLFKSEETIDKEKSWNIVDTIIGWKIRYQVRKANKKFQ